MAAISTIVNARHFFAADTKGMPVVGRTAGFFVVSRHRRVQFCPSLRSLGRDSGSRVTLASNAAAGFHVRRLNSRSYLSRLIAINGTGGSRIAPAGVPTKWAVLPDVGEDIPTGILFAVADCCRLPLLLPVVIFLADQRNTDGHLTAGIFVARNRLHSEHFSNSDKFTVVRRGPLHRGPGERWSGRLHLALRRPISGDSVNYFRVECFQSHCCLTENSRPQSLHLRW